MKPTKDQMIAALIANEKSLWNKEDEPALKLLSEERLQCLQEAEPEEEEEEEEVEEPETVPETPKTTEEYLSAAPPEIRAALTQALNHQAEAKKGVIAKLTANKCPWTKEELETKDLSELQRLADFGLRDYTGQGGGPAGNTSQAVPQMPPVLRAKKEAATAA